MYQQQIRMAPPSSPKSRTIALILCIFLGWLGIHRFYVDKIGTGILYLCTEGLFGIGVLVDFILILTGSFTDGAGLPLIEWDGYKSVPVTVTTTYQPYPQQTYTQPPPYPITPQQPQKSYPSPQQPKSQAKYCPICGSANELSSTYCSSCGSVLES
ncbi:MAG: NINE protein [Candidatus Heimdallarchaeota archaeon]|nr:NINE protein [Candidatus Heimdallarchaeota archaeon]